jgi:tRNA1(Val) A37 N6-methylase TrmN6
MRGERSSRSTPPPARGRVGPPQAVRGGGPADPPPARHQRFPHGEEAGPSPGSLRAPTSPFQGDAESDAPGRIESGAITEDAILGGRLHLLQPRRGHRVGHDAILLAAACPAWAGDAVADLGAGVGAAGLALAARVGGTSVTLVEIEAGLAALATENARRNGLDACARAVVLDVAAPARAFAAAGLAPHTCMRVIMNPPFNDAGRHQPSPDARRRLAHAAPPAELSIWIKTATRLLRPRGTLSLIWRADGLAEVLAALAPAFGEIALMPVHPKPDAPAIRILLRATKSRRAPLAILPALVLNDSAGRPTAEAETVLRAGEPLALGMA